MSAQDHLSPQQFTIPLYRGLDAKKVNQPLGMHWSKNEQVAHNFAATPRPAPGVLEKTTVVNALARPRDVINPRSLEGLSITAGYPNEEELPVRSGSPVLVTGLVRKSAKHREVGPVVNFPDGVSQRQSKVQWRARKINYNPPREMKA